MPLFVDEKYGEAMIKRQEQVLPALRARRAMMLKLMKTTTSAQAICAIDMVIRRHEVRQKQDE